MEFRDLACMTQDEIMACALALDGAEKIGGGDSVLVRGNLPFVLVAHTDTVYGSTPLPSDIVGDGLNVWTKTGCGHGIGGDDRAGCWCLFQVAAWESRPSLLFCADEETCAGSSVGLNSLDWSDQKCFIEVDGPKFGVFYSDGSSNRTLDDFMSDVIGLHKLPSSYNDIAEICTAGNPPGITLGTAYYNQHDADGERVNLAALGVVLDIIGWVCDSLHLLPWSVVPERKTVKVGSKWSGSAGSLALPSGYGSSPYSGGASLYDWDDSEPYSTDVYGVGDYGEDVDESGEGCLPCEVEGSGLICATCPYWDSCGEYEDEEARSW